MLDKKLLSILVCPKCKGNLEYVKPAEGIDEELICRADRLGYPVHDDIPVMLEVEARHIPLADD